ncbi:MAG TPA: RNA 2',3'-cyclic phosphodiesterase [Usitatibacter sp.]|jgi:2'-5' RNA ligase|nr:RNA 2',3'-cyclic phosphodiesterase [Usitatibacter sp.]
MARLFFAVWPGESSARALARLAADVALDAQGKPVPPEKIHLTLAFLGEVAPERAAAAREAASAVAFRPFAFALDQVGSFRVARVAWAGSREAPVALAELQAALAARLRAERFAIEDRPFAPHATLARRTRRPLRAASIEPIEWRVEAFTLVRSESGTGRYEVVEEFPAR